MHRSIRTRIIALFAIATVIIVATAGGLSYLHIYEYEHKITDVLGVNAARAIDAVLEYSISEDELMPGSPDFEEIREELRKACRELRMDYLYVFRCDVQNDTASYIICVADDDANDSRVARELGYGTVVNIDYDRERLIAGALANEDVQEALVLENEYGSMLSWFRKVDSWEGDVLVGVDYSITEQRNRVFTASMSVVAPVVVVMLVVMLTLLLILQRHAFNPLHTIASRMKAFKADGAATFEPIGIKSNDEMGEIAEAFDGMAEDIADYLHDIERLTTERVQADVEISVARRIQLGMVPERTELAGPGFGVCAVSRTARSVGGDFYDVFVLDDGCVAAVVGDISGKGIAAAMFMSMTAAIVHDGLFSGNSPAAVLKHTNDQMCASNPEGMFATVFACVLDPATGEVRFANAGHLPPLVAGEHVRTLDVKPGVLLGLFEDADLEEGMFVLEKGECLFAFTDGVTEAVNAKREFFGDAALVSCISEHAPLSDAGAAVDAVVAAVDAFAAGCEQFDDLTAVALFRMSADDTRSESRLLPLEFASFAAVRAAIFSQAHDDAAGRKACLACEEAFSNIVQYSGATNIWFSVSCDGDYLRVRLEDDGVPFDPFAADPVSKPFEELDSGGMGINLIRNIAKSATYARTDGRNILTLVFQ